MIDVERLEKHYGSFVAVDDVSFTAAPGEIFGLLGPNGAGKSTTIGCISGLLEPTAGRVRVLGKDVVVERRAAREQLGVVPQEMALYEDLSATENLRFWGAAYGLRGSTLTTRVRDVLATTGLADRAKEPVSQYSGGMKRRINFGCAIVHRPKVVLLDEPTVGVDPQSRVRLFEMVKTLVADGTTVLYTTHYMEEAEQLCDRLAIIDRGKLIANGTLEELRGQVGERDLLQLTGHFDAAAVEQALGAVDDVEVVQVEPDALRLALRDASSRLPALFDALTTAGSEIRQTTLTEPSLETLFIKLTGKELRE
ncbi:MAG: ABC transporter ATP-binding protein [Planctomycetota bacterium]|nr:ABC transporter ATP-binding protein [Planctomycetota bacterium]